MRYLGQVSAETKSCSRPVVAVKLLWGKDMEIFKGMSTLKESQQKHGYCTEITSFVVKVKKTAALGFQGEIALVVSGYQTAMSRVAGIVCAVSLVLYGASWPFILPASTPRGAPQQGAGAVAGQPSASSAAPESAGSWSPIAIGAALGLLAAVATTRPALAADLENGEAVFQGNCTACHAGGNNSIVAEKKLKKDALVTYGKYDVGAIITQVTNGNGSMPAFGDKLGPDDIEERTKL